MASNFSVPNCSCQSTVARFCATKSPRYPARFLKFPERKSSITVRCASGNFSCNASVRFEPMKPAPPVTSRFEGDSVEGTGRLRLVGWLISLDSRSVRKLVMQKRSVWLIPWSASVSDAGFGVAPKQSFLRARRSGFRIAQEKFAIARRARQHPRRARSSIRVAALLLVARSVCFGQETLPTPSPGEAEVEQVVVSATRFDIPLDRSPASVSVISSEDLDQ